MEAWQIYLEEFRQRAGDADGKRMGRHDLLAEAAHDAYQAAADRLTREHGWSDEHTLVIMRGLNAAVRKWLESASGAWATLEAELQRREQEMSDGFGDAIRAKHGLGVGDSPATAVGAGEPRPEGASPAPQPAD